MRIQLLVQSPVSAVGLLLFSLGCKDIAGEDRLTETLPLSDRVVFTSDRADSLGDVYTMHTGGTMVTRRTDSTTRDQCALLSPDGNWIALHQLSRAKVRVTSFPPAQDSIVIMRADGTSPKAIQLQERYQLYGTTFCPQWSRDSERLLIVGNTEEIRTRSITNYRTRVIDRAGTVLGSYDMGAKGTLGSIAISPDGRALAAGLNDVSTGPSINYRVVTMSIDGTNQRTLGQGRQPTWSASATRVAWICGGVCTASPEGANVQMVYDGPPITNGPLFPLPSASSPVFSPDEQQLAFGCKPVSGGYTSLCIVNLASRAIDETFLGGSVGQIVWTPDSKTLVFECVIGNPEICSLSNDLPRLRNLTANPASDRFPTVR